MWAFSQCGVENLATFKSDNAAGFDGDNKGEMGTKAVVREIVEGPRSSTGAEGSVSDC